MMLLMRLAFLLYGRLLSSSDDGGSVPRARAPMVSMMRLTQSIITAFRGGSLPVSAVMKVRVRATALTVCGSVCGVIERE